MRMMLVLAIWALSGCGKPQTIEVPFIPYVRTFEAVYGQPVALDINFSDVLQIGQSGLCLHDGNILISREIWDHSTDTEKELVIFHELGHCVLNREHDMSLNAKGYPNSYMYTGSVDIRYPQVSWREYIASHQKEYRAEMVSGVGK